jgi:hypothetical protein
LLRLIDHRLREQRGLLVLLLVAAFSFSAITSAALAAHFHAYACDGGCSIGHGVVHGDSTTDGSFFSRIDAHASGIPGSFWSTCALYANLTHLGSEETPYGQGCSPWSGGTGFWNESQARATVVSQDGSQYAIPSHTHTAH